MLRAHIPNRPHRFAIRSCSQCGKVFGPGDSGFSNCTSHLGLPILRWPETPDERKQRVAHDHLLRRQIELQHQMKVTL